MSAAGAWVPLVPSTPGDTFAILSGPRDVLLRSRDGGVSQHALPAGETHVDLDHYAAIWRPAGDGASYEATSDALLERLTQMDERLEKIARELRRVREAQ